MPAATSTREKIGLAGIGALTFGWFGTSWQVLGKPLVDAVGETVGGVSVVLLIASVIGALTRPPADRL